MILDPVSDAGFSYFYRLNQNIVLPELVKQANFATKEEVSSLPKTAFADADKRMFPAHTKAACLLSYAYFKSQERSFDKTSAVKIGSRLESFIKFYDLQKEAADVNQALTSTVEKKASVTVVADFALQISNGEKQYHLYPIGTAHALVKSAEQLIHDRSKLTYTLRKEAATKLVRKAMDFGMSITSLPETIQKMAGCGFALKASAEHQIQRRVNSAKLTHEKAAAAKLAEMKERVNMLPGTILTADTLEKVATALDMYDRYIGITPEYGKSFPYPEDALFSFTKTAGVALKNELVQLTSGSTYWLKDLEKASEALEAVEGLGSELKDVTGSIDLMKVAQILPTLPKDAASLLETALNAMGVPKATLDKEAMVLLTSPDKLPKMRPIFKRAEAKADTRETRKEDYKNQAARKYDGKFLRKAPNEVTAEKTAATGMDLFKKD